MDVCPNCHAGALHRRPVTYAAWHTLSDEGDERFVIVPQVPAWLCNVCGLKLFDADVLAWLAPLLGPAVDAEAGGRRPIPRRGRQAPRDTFDGDLDRGHIE